MASKTVQRGYGIRFGMAMFLYSISVILVLPLARTQAEDNPMRYLIALIPVIPLFFAFLSYMWYVRRVDELQRRIQFEAIAFSMGITIFLTLTLGFLETVGFPRIDMLWVPILMVLIWGLGSIMASRRYG